MRTSAFKGGWLPSYRGGEQDALCTRYGPNLLMLQDTFNIWAAGNTLDNHPCPILVPVGDGWGALPVAHTTRPSLLGSMSSVGQSETRGLGRTGHNRPLVEGGGWPCRIRFGLVAACNAHRPAPMRSALSCISSSLHGAFVSIIHHLLGFTYKRLKHTLTKLVEGKVDRKSQSRC